MAASNTTVITKDYFDAHHLAIGRFVATYSLLESKIRDVLNRYAELSAAVAPLFTGRMRAMAMANLIEAVAINRGLDRQISDDLVALHRRLDPIAKFRDATVHCQWVATADGVALTNTNAARDYDAFMLDLVPVEVLQQHMMEAEKLIWDFSRHMLKKEYWDKLPAKHKEPGRYPWFEHPGPAVTIAQRGRKPRVAKN
jgi:hypothetical protein